MKISILILFIILCRISIAQDSTVTWIKNIDTSAFQILYNKKNIPKEFYRVQNIKDIKKLANPNDKYSPSCINPIRGQLNWIAKQKNQWVISITYGGKSVCTRFFFLDKKNDSLNINEINFDWPLRKDATLGYITTLIKSGQYEFEEYDAEQYTLDKE